MAVKGSPKEGDQCSPRAEDRLPFVALPILLVSEGALASFSRGPCKEVLDESMRIELHS